MAIGGEEMTKVFITDGMLRKTLSTTRSLGRRRIQTVVGETSWFSPSGFSRYSTRRVKYPNPKIEPHLFIQWLYRFFHQEKRPVFFPMDDAVMEVVMEHRGEVMARSKCLLPTKESYNVASDKYLTMTLANQQQVECPPTYLAKNVEDLTPIMEVATFPLILKPRKSSGSRGIRKVQHKEELKSLFLEAQQQYPDMLIQECIPLGDRYDVCLLYDANHEVKASFVQKEIRHFPVQMGPSTVQESVVFKELIERSMRLLEPLKWSGIVEVEFMMDERTNTPILMEINPRFWNSLDLSVQSGIDFPYFLYQLCQGEKVSLHTMYEVGRRSRWLFPGDILHFLWNPKRKTMNPPLFSGDKHRVYDDTFSKKDPLPGIVWIFTCFRLLLDGQALKKFIMR